MLVARWLRTPLALALIAFACLAVDGCGMPRSATERPAIRVAIGMTAEQLYAGSTYPFQESLGRIPAYPGGPAPRDWVITEPYDLTYVYEGRELRENDLGGDNYLLAITTDPIRGPVDSVRVTYQNRALTLDEALAVAERLEDWFVAASFHPLPPDAPEPRKLVDPFHIERQERSASPYTAPIASYQSARAAFLDPHAQIIEIIPFVLEAADVGVGLHIVNARRQREDLADEKHETNLTGEREYFVNLSIGARSLPRAESTGPTP